MKHTLIALWLASMAVASPPPGYYDAVLDKTGPALRSALHDLVDHHTVLRYGDTTRALMQLDAVPGGRVRLLYARDTHPRESKEWNKEHVWPQSHGVTSGPGHSDLHHLFACDVTVNNQRANLPFDRSGPRPGHPEAPDSRADADSWEPPDYHKGDVARAMLYMDVRYEGDAREELDLVLSEDAPRSQPRMGKLSVLLAWHALDPVDDFERTRNDAIYDRWQHNRNPFIDHPELVSALWGTPTVTATPQPPAAPAPAPAGAFFVAGPGKRVYHISKDCEGAKHLRNPIHGEAATAGRRPHQGCPQLSR